MSENKWEFIDYVAAGLSIIGLLTISSLGVLLVRAIFV